MKKDKHNLHYIDDHDLDRIKHEALRSWTNRASNSGDQALAKAYFDAVVGFLVKNNLMTNVSYKFGSIDEKDTSIDPVLPSESDGDV